MAFRMDKLTLKAQEALQNGQSLAGERGNPEMDPLHLLSAVLADGDGIARPVLEKIGAKLTKLTKDQAAYLGVDVNGPYKPEHYRY